MAQGGLIKRDKPLSFVFDGQSLPAFYGDSLASALLANDKKLVARSFKYHRPRGIFSAGSDEPNALTNIGEGAHSEPNCKATMVELKSMPNVRLCLNMALVGIYDANTHMGVQTPPNSSIFNKGPPAEPRGQLKLALQKFMRLSHLFETTNGL